VSDASDPRGLPLRARAVDNRLIELETRGELDFWLKVFHTTEDRLLAAISAVGPYAGAVAEELQRTAAN
jgi:hypothetical protein